MSAAVVVFLVFLLFAVQILIGLYGRSVVTGAAYDGARSVAGSRVDHDDPGAVARAQAGAVAGDAEGIAAAHGRTAAGGEHRRSAEIAAQ